MGKLAVYIKNFMLELWLLSKASGKLFYQRLFSVRRLGLSGACVLLLLMFLSMVVTISCSSPSSPSSGVGIKDDDISIKGEGFRKGEPGKITFTFIEGVSDFTLDDIEFTGVDVAKGKFVTNSDSSYTLTVIPKATGEFTVTISEDKVYLKDSGVRNTESTTVDINVEEGEVSQLTISTNNSEITFTFIEGVSDFTLDDIEFTGVDVAKGKFVTNSDSSYTLTVIPKATGEFTITISEDKVYLKDSGVRNTESATVKIDVEEGEVSQLTISTNNTNPFKKGESSEITFTFIEGVSDFTLDDIEFTGVDVIKSSFVTNSDSIYTLTVIPKVTGEFTVTIPEDKVYLKDSGVRNTDSATVDIDVIKGPDLTISTDDSKPFRKGEPEQITFTFMEGVSDFTLDDIVFTGVDVAKGKFVTNSDSSYTLTVIPKATGEFTVTISEDKVYLKDSGVRNTESATVDINVEEGEVSQLTISTNDSKPFRKGEPEQITFTFMEGVSDFTLDDIEFTGVDVAKGKFVTNSDSSYTLTVIPKATGEFTVTISEDKVYLKDSGVRNTESATVDINVEEGEVSQLTISTNNSEITFTFMEGVSDFTLDDIEFTGVDVAKGKFVTNSDSSYTLTVIPKATGEFTVTISEDKVYLKDSGVRNTESATIDINVEEGEVSQLTISTNNTNPFKKGEPEQITFTFIEGVSDFTLDDIGFTGIGVIKSSFVTNSDSIYTLTVIPKASGEFTVTIPEDKVYLKDSGVRNTESATVDIDVEEGVEPLPFLTISSGSLKNGLSAYLFFTFSEEVSNSFTIGDVELYGVSASKDEFEVSSSSSLTYSLKITPSGEGDMTVIIPTGAVSDTSGTKNASPYMTNFTVHPSTATFHTVSITLNGGRSLFPQVTNISVLEGEPIQIQEEQLSQMVSYPPTGPSSGVTAVTRGLKEWRSGGNPYNFGSVVSTNVSLEAVWTNSCGVAETSHPTSFTSLQAELIRAIYADLNANLNYIDTSAVINMGSLFEGFSAGGTQFAGSMSCWNTSKVTSMAYMFVAQINFNDDISGWDVSSVKNMTGMFDRAFSFDQDLSGWNVGAVTKRADIFKSSAMENKTAKHPKWQ